MNDSRRLHRPRIGWSCAFINVTRTGAFERAVLARRILARQLICLSFSSLASRLWSSKGILCLCANWVTKKHSALLGGALSAFRTGSPGTQQILKLAFGASDESRSYGLFLNGFLRFGTEDTSTRLSATTTFLDILLRKRTANVRLVQRVCCEKWLTRNCNRRLARRRSWCLEDQRRVPFVVLRPQSTWSSHS